MNKSDALRVDVVKHADKEKRLFDFIVANLPACLSAGRSILVLARSFESPVARALASAQSSGLLTDINLRAIVLEQSPVPAQRTEVAAPDLLAVHAARFIKDRRFLDAHEQLVLAPHVTWVGDCMRRDPSIRDAFETTSTTSARTAAHATNSFERLWALAQPLANHRKPVVVPLAQAAPSVDSTSGDTQHLPNSPDCETEILISGRH